MGWAFPEGDWAYPLLSLGQILNAAGGPVLMMAPPPSSFSPPPY